MLLVMVNAIKNSTIDPIVVTEVTWKLIFSNSSTLNLSAKYPPNQRSLTRTGDNPGVESILLPRARSAGGCR